MNEEIFCPCCGSNQLTANKKGFSGKKAVAGAILTGGIGLLAGTIGSNKVKITCLACGHEFKPGQGKNREEIEEQQRRREQVKPMGKQEILIIFIVAFVILVIWIISTFKGCNSDKNTNEDKQNISNAENIAKPEKIAEPEINISNIQYEILVKDIANGEANINVYLKKDSNIRKLNSYLINHFKSLGNLNLFIYYFDDREVAINFFDWQLDKKYSDKKCWLHYRAFSNYNPSSGNNELTFVH